ncbi:MAG: alpha/beta hydrolase [Myxococcota bacterium]
MSRVSHVPTVFSSPPTSERPQGRPPRARTFGEWRTLLQPVRLFGARARLAAAPRGDGRLVIDIPGYQSPESAMAPIRLFLRSKGHDARPWGFGVNRGDPERDRMRLLARLESLVSEAGRPVNLVAWSLGGIIAREVARLRPDLVHRVVVYGSPLIGGPTYTVAADFTDEKEQRRIAALQEQLDREQPVQVPITTIFSRRDGVVSWRACLDHYSPRATHVEVRSSHIGLGIDPDVWLAVAEALAARSHRPGAPERGAAGPA